MITDSIDTSTTINVVSDGRELAVSGGASLIAALSGVVAMVQDLPFNGAIALAGLVVSGWIQVTRIRNDGRIKEYARDVLHLQAAVRDAAGREGLAREECAANRKRDQDHIADLLAKLEANDARNERLMASVLKWLPADNDDARAAIAEIAKPDVGSRSLKEDVGKQPIDAKHITA